MALFRARGVPLLLPTMLLFVAACNAAPPATPAATPRGSGGPGPGSAIPAPSASADAVTAAATLIGAAKLTDPTSLGALEAIRFTAAGIEAAAAVMAAGGTDDALWAAAYVYASSARDAAPLRTLVQSSTASASVRTLAAAGMVGLGDIDGFEPLIASLDTPEPMAGADPAGTIWEFAAGVLGRYTTAGFGPNLDATDAERTAIAGQWTTWFEANKGTLRFDQPSQLWVTA